MFFWGIGTLMMGLKNETLTELYGDADSTIDRCCFENEQNTVIRVICR
jgi:hypothetical protein